MSQLARIAVGRWHSEMDFRPMLWALCDGLDHQGFRVQTFLSHAYCEPFDAATSITGLCPRHLDSWLMNAERIKTLFSRSAIQNDLSIVWGDWPARPDQKHLSTNQPQFGGRLDELVKTLRMPTIMVLDVARLRTCELDRLPPETAGVLLDGVADAHEYAVLQTNLETLWNVPVLGALGKCTALRQQISQLTPGEAVPRELCRHLGQDILHWLDVPRIMSLAQHCPTWKQAQKKPLRKALHQPHRFLKEKYSETADAPASLGEQFSSKQSRPLRIAVAYDDAFHCYFPDVLEECELAGAIVQDFSPLRDESLPLDTDLVYFGCGHPELFAEQLMANTCLQSALREHVCAGRRIYAEGGGMAALCREIVLADGSRYPMAGIFPAVARMQSPMQRPEATELQFQSKSWLGPAGQTLRTYRNRNWMIEPTDHVQVIACDHANQPDMIVRHNAIGSRLQLDFAAFPNLLENFLSPCPAALDWAVGKS